MKNQKRFVYNYKTRILTDKTNKQNIKVHDNISVGTDYDNGNDYFSFGIETMKRLWFNDSSFDFFKALNKILFAIDAYYSDPSNCQVIRKIETLKNIEKLFINYYNLGYYLLEKYKIDSHKFIKKKQLSTKTYLDVLDNLLEGANLYKLNNKTIHYVKCAYCVGDEIYEFIYVFRKLKQVILKDKPNFQMEELEKTKESFKDTYKNIEESYNRFHNSLNGKAIKKKENEIISIIRIIGNNLSDFCNFKNLQEKIIGNVNYFRKTPNRDKILKKRNELKQKLNELESYFQYGFDNYPKNYLGGKEGPYTIAYEKYSQENKVSSKLKETQFNKYFQIWLGKRIYIYRREKIIELFNLKEKLDTTKNTIENFSIELEDFLDDEFISCIDEPEAYSVTRPEADEESFKESLFDIMHGQILDNDYR